MEGVYELMLLCLPKPLVLKTLPVPLNCGKRYSIKRYNTYYIKSKWVKVVIERTVRGIMRKELLTRMFSSSYIPSAHKIESLLHELEGCGG